MISKELTQYVDTQIKEALKSQPVVGDPTDPGLQRRLESVELLLVAAIQALQELPPQLGWKESFSKIYSRLKKKKAQGVAAANAELHALLDSKRRIFPKS